MDELKFDEKYIIAHNGWLYTIKLKFNPATKKIELLELEHNFIIGKKSKLKEVGNER